MVSPFKWALEWSSDNALNGARRHLIYSNLMPVLFTSREDARRYARERYGYLKDRPDLRGEPHGWRMPRPIRVRVTATSHSFTVEAQR